MGLSSAELERHCQQILNDRRIKNKIVVLCEGKINNVDGRLSPQTYRKMEQMPDANFYKKCVPKSWNDKPKPQFFNCGDRSSVIDTYFNLLKLSNLGQSYLNRTKLFALVDLDIQLHKIENYQFSDTEQIFNNLYQATQVMAHKASLHFIWVTGLIHKEAYFIAPEMQTVFDNSTLEPQYSNLPILLKDLYFNMCQELTEDTDLKSHFERVSQRINYCPQLNCNDLEQLKDCWNKEYIKSLDNQSIRELVLALLTIIKAKKYWHQIEPPNYWTRESARFREQLSLEIGEFYSKLDWHNPKYHLPYFYQTLYQLA
ncbi:MAG: hypothetical protein AAGF83_03230 [Cyanobacteria bacterium P01_G01_bin.67]